MSTHNGAVTVVRFSPSGTYLASGSDDRVVLIWAKDDTRQPRQEFGQQGEADSEVWVAQKRLTAHENDVQDLAWSPDGSLLVTVGLDSSIIIWSGSTFEKLQTLNPHGSHVKGITFDPANKYFATASDDRSVKIFRYHRTGSDITFQVESTISNPFVASPLSTYFRRLSWSPDGTLIAAPNATNGPVSTVALISRGSWEADISLVGHDAPCEVAAFCNRVFSPQKPEDRPAKPEDHETVQVIATASQDKTLAIWNSATSRPLLVARNITGKAITDITWTPDGSKLFASSLDGSILLAAFDEGELGYPLPTADIQSQLTRYGGGRDALQIPESVDQVRLENTLPDQPDKNVHEKKMDQIMGNDKGEAASSFTSLTNGNPPTASATGAASSAPAGTATISAQPSNPSSGQNSSSATTSTNTSTTTSAATSTTTPSASTNSTASSSRPVQNITITKDGKKRLAPQLITTSQPRGSNGSMVSSTAAPGNGAHALRASGAPAERNVQVMELSQPSYALPKGGVSSLVIGTKRKHEKDEDDDNSNGGLPSEEPNKKAKHEEIPEFMKPCVASPASTVSQVRLGVPKVRTFFNSSEDSNKNGDDGKSVLEVRNGTGNEYEPTRVTVTKAGQLLFADFLPKHGHLATGQGNIFWAVATEEGALYLYSPSGRRLMPNIVLGSPISFLESQGANLLAVTAIGMVHVWNIAEQKALHEPISLAPILDTGLKYLENGVIKAPSLTQCAVTKTGKIVVTLNNGSGYTYNHAMYTWNRISEDWWNIGSQFWDSSSKSKVSGAVGMCEKRTNEVQLKRGRGQQLQRATRNRMMQGGYEGFETVVSLAHLENKIGAAILLDSKDEFREFLITYAYQIAEQGLTDRVEELCKELLGPVVANTEGSSSSWSPTVCGLDKHDLLRLVIEKIGKMRQVQRVVVDYAKTIGVF